MNLQPRHTPDTRILAHEHHGLSFERTNERMERKWWCGKVDALRVARQKLQRRKREGERKRRESSVASESKRNGAKVYFVEEKAACHATMGPHSGDVGVPRGPRDQDDHGASKERRGRRSVRVFARRETGGAGGRWRGKGRGGGKCSNSSSSCRCQCPPSCYPRRGPLKDIGGDRGGPSAPQPKPQLAS